LKCAKTRQQQCKIFKIFRGVVMEFWTFWILDRKRGPTGRKERKGKDYEEEDRTGSPTD